MLDRSGSLRLGSRHKLLDRKGGPVQRKLVSHFLVLAVGMAMGLGAVAVAQNQQPQAQSSSDAQIVRQLKDINTKLGYNFKKTSLVGYTFEGFNDLYRAMVETCNALNRSISGSSIGCPSFGH